MARLGACLLPHPGPLPEEEGAAAHFRVLSATPLNATSFALLLDGALITAALSTVSVLLGFAIGALVCTAQLSRIRAVRAAGAVYVSFFRGVPLLVQLLLIYNLLPGIGVNVPGTVAALVGLTLCTAAYQAEILRGGFLAVPPGLVEAGQMVGLSPALILLRIRVPLALRLTLPSVVNEAVLILKASSLVSVVGIADLTRTAQNIASSTYRPIEAFATAGALYLVLNAVLIGVGVLLGRRMRGAE